MNQPFIRTIILIDKQLLDITIHRGGVQGEAVVLHGDEAPQCLHVGTGLVVPPVPVLQLVKCAALTETHQLGAHADPKRGDHIIS